MEHRPVKRKRLPSAKVLRELFVYRPDTGELIWRVDRRQVRAGDIAGRVGHQGYRCVGIDLGVYYEHRVIWKWQTGSDPATDIDHIDLVRSNNRWANLRLATASQNRANMNLLASNTSGVRGVCWDKRRGRWVANIKKDGRRFHLGYFVNKADASRVYRDRYAEMFGCFVRAA